MVQDYPPSRNESVAVGVTSVEIAPARERVLFYIKNTSAAAQTVTVVLGPVAAVAGAGIVLEPGDFISDSDGDIYRAWRGPILAISSAAGATLAVTER